MDEKSKKRKNKLSRINTRVDDDLASDLSYVSYMDDDTISQVVRKALKAYIAGRKSTY